MGKMLHKHGNGKLFRIVILLAKLYELMHPVLQQHDKIKNICVANLLNHVCVQPQPVFLQ